MAGKKGFGAKLQYDSGSGSYVDVANITKIRPFDAKADVIDITDMASPSEYREKLAGLLEAGAVNFDLNYNEGLASHAYLMTNLGQAKNWKIIFPIVSGSKVATFSGFVKQVSPEIPHDNKMTCSAAIEITGVVAFA